MLRKALFRAGLRLPLALVPLVLGACGDSSGGGGGSPPATYWVFIDPGADSVSTGQIDLYGSASCDACPPTEVAFGFCPPVQGPFVSSIDILWTNRTTGAQGGAFHGISGRCACLFSTCWVSYTHAWMATVPLAMGPNVIELGAFGPASLPGSETITVTRTPPAPAGLVARGGAGEIELRWEPVAGADSYDVYWSTTRDVSVATAQRIPGVSSPFRHTGLADDLSLHYAVSAVASGQGSPLSSLAWATAGWATTRLPVPAGATVYADTALATDGLDHVHVHLSTQAPGGASEQNTYATDASGSWVAAPVALTSWRNADIAIDSVGLVHLSYLRPEGLLHAWGGPGAWSTEVVDAGGVCEARLALDASDDVQLAYRTLTAPPELHLARQSTGWLAERVDAADAGCASGVTELALATEGDGTPHLVYSGAAPALGLFHATKPGSAWIREEIEPGAIQGAALALAPDGTPHVAFVDTQGVLRHARREASGAWTSARIDPEEYMATPSLAVDAAGNVHVAYLAFGYGGELRYATDATTDGAWRRVRVAPATYAGVALALDLDGGIHISYFDVADACYVTHR